MSADEGQHWKAFDHVGSFSIPRQGKVVLRLVI